MIETAQFRHATATFIRVDGTIISVITRAFIGTAIASILCFFTASSYAGDNGRYPHVSLSVKAWIESLTNKNGVGCCATADGFRPEEVSWNLATNSYLVKMNGQWLLVPHEAVIQDANRLGHPVVWLEPGGDLDVEHDTPLVRCFLPGVTS